MATIDSVKLPDNSTYDLTDNYSGYAKKVAGATTDDLASLTATGDLADSGKKLSDLVLKTDVKDVLNSTSTTDPLSANMGRVLKENLYKRNLLKNGWFTINERGWTSGVPSNDYVANDWLGLAVSPSDIITNNNGTLTLTVDTLLEIKQFLENASGLDGLAVTASVKMADDTIKQGTATFDHSNDLTFFSDTSLTLYYRASDEYFRLTAYSTITIKAIKLELGTESTLANDIAPNKTLELLKCQEADVSGLSNENLVDNGWFTVNQRGATTVTSGLGADRWKFVEGTSATYSSNGVSLNNSFICQIFENQLPNGLYTASVKYQDGTIEYGTAIKADDSTVITFFTSSTGFKLMFTPLAKRFDVNGKNGSTTSIRAVKLELGSKSTLAHDVAPDYTTELLKCQRYFYQMTNGAFNSVLGVGYAESATMLRLSLVLPVPMRSATPTVTFSGLLKVVGKGVEKVITSFIVRGNCSNVQVLSAVTTDLVSNELYTLVAESNSTLSISADL